MKLISKYMVPASPGEKKKRRKDWRLLIFSGVLLGLSFPPFPFPVTLLIFFGLVPYFFVLERRETLAQISRGTFIFTFVFSLITIYWVGSWQSEADPFLMIGGGALLLAYPCVLLIPSTLYYLTKKIFPRLNAFYFFPLFWVTTEYLLTLTDLRFPWVLLGHGLAQFQLFIQVADLIGTFGLSLVVAYINVFIFLAITRYRSGKKIITSEPVIAILIFMIVLVYGVYRSSSFEISGRKIKIGLVQPDINPWAKWEVANLNTLLDTHLKLSQEAVDSGAQLIIWPETALPVFTFGGNYNLTAQKIRAFVDSNGVSLLTGMPDIRYYFSKEDAPKDAKQSANKDYYYTTYNSVFMLTPDSRELQKYGKMKLVPIGERVPFSDQISFLGDIFKWGVGLSGWNVGQDTTIFKILLNERDTVKISGLVCYESVFPVFVTNFVERGAELITVVTNDSWYGRSSGPYQHQEFAILRAVENRRSVVRAANGGISCFINPLGKIESETELFTQSLLVGYAALQSEETFYTKTASIIPVFCSVFSLWIFGINILLWIKKKFSL